MKNDDHEAFDDDGEYDPIGWVMQRQRERSKMLHSCTECDFSTTDKWLSESHNCTTGPEMVNGHCVDWPACGHELNDCQGLRYGSDESIKALHYDLITSGMDDYEIDAFYDRMDRGY